MLMARVGVLGVAHTVMWEYTPTVEVPDLATMAMWQHTPTVMVGLLGWPTQLCQSTPMLLHGLWCMIHMVVWE